MIPALAHYIWIGGELPWVHAAAMRSAARAGGFERVVLTCDRDLSHTPAWRELAATPGFESRRLDPQALFAASGADAAGLLALYARLRAPAARANMVRAALLAAEGGVYLDTDTVVVAPLTPLRAAGAFCGVERVAFPAAVMRRPAWRRGRSYALSALREVFRLLPGGYRGFRRVEDLYALEVNNAVLAATPGHPLVMALLEGMLRTPPERQTVRYALGTHLLQETVERGGWGDLVVHPPEVFYPLGPEISEHWLRLRRRVDLGAVVGPATRVVHWYASVRAAELIPRIDADYVRAHRERQLLSALLADYA